MIILIGGYIVNFIVEKLNIDHASLVLPGEFEGYYDAVKYEKSQTYLRENTHLGFIERAAYTAAAVIFILSGWLNLIDGFARSFGRGPVFTGLIFFGVIYLLSYAGSIIFSVYRTFIIEERYGFNKTTPQTFIGDIFKQLILSVIIGSITLSAILWFFGFAGRFAWLYSWIAVTVFQLFIIFVAPVTIMPLFNKFTPLEEGRLRKAIIDYAGSQDFKISGIYKMDGSRRSSKSNAFFTGLGRYKRIALFDTLIDRMTTEELMSVLAHEIGHYKNKDILKYIAASIISTGVMLFMASLFIYNRDLSAAFRMDNVSVYAGLLFFTFLYAPVGWVLSVISNCLSRRHEYAADAFSVNTYKHPEAMTGALKRLSVDNLTNLTPHPLKVFIAYTHPPVLARIKSIKQQAHLR